MSRSESSACKWTGELPAFGKNEKCVACEKLRSAGEVIRCRFSGPRVEGVGDIVAAVAKVTGVAKVVELFTDGECDCPRRRAALNRLIPFGASVPEPASPPVALPDEPEPSQ